MDGNLFSWESCQELKEKVKEVLDMMANLLGSMPKPAAGASADPLKDGSGGFSTWQWMDGCDFTILVCVGWSILLANRGSFRFCPIFRRFRWYAEGYSYSQWYSNRSWSSSVGDCRWFSYILTTSHNVLSDVGAVLSEIRMLKPIKRR